MNMIEAAKKAWKAKKRIKMDILSEPISVDEIWVLMPQEGNPKETSKYRLDTLLDENDWTVV